MTGGRGRGRKREKRMDLTFLCRMNLLSSFKGLLWPFWYFLVVILLDYEIKHLNCLRAYKTHFVPLRFIFILNHNTTSPTLLSYCWKLVAGPTERDNAISASVSPTNPSSIPWLLSFLLYWLVYSMVTQWFAWGRHFVLLLSVDC